MPSSSRSRDALLPPASSFYRRKWAGAISAPGPRSTSCSRGKPGRSFPQGNFLWSPKKFVAAVGIRDLVVVETDDALLLCPRDRAQDVGKIVKWLEAEKF